MGREPRRHAPGSGWPTPRARPPPDRPRRGGVGLKKVPRRQELEPPVAEVEDRGPRQASRHPTRARATPGTSPRLSARGPGTAARTGSVPRARGTTRARRSRRRRNSRASARGSGSRRLRCGFDTELRYRQERARRRRRALSRFGPRRPPARAPMSGCTPATCLSMAVEGSGRWRAKQFRRGTRRAPLGEDRARAGRGASGRATRADRPRPRTQAHRRIEDRARSPISRRASPSCPSRVPPSAREPGRPEGRTPFVACSKTFARWPTGARVGVSTRDAHGRRRCRRSTSRRPICGMLCCRPRGVGSVVPNAVAASAATPRSARTILSRSRFETRSSTRHTSKCSSATSRPS